MVTRRSFLQALGALGLVSACGPFNPSPPPPPGSPVYRGKYSVGRALLGTTPNTQALPFLRGISEEFSGVPCPTGTISVPRPAQIPIMVYYPSTTTSYDVSRPVSIHPDGGFPIVLFGHARRLLLCPNAFPPGLDPTLLDITQDFRRIDFVLDHVASQGFVICVPDVSWDWSVTETGGMWPGLGNARAQVLVATYWHMSTMNQGVFQQQIDLRVLGLAGHSTGCAACLISRSHLGEVGAPEPRAHVFIAPATTPQVALLAGEIGQTLTIKGTLDSQMSANPDEVFGQSALPKGRITISGANHFGYTEICTPDNKVCAADDPPGAIARLSQQVAGATFMGAFLRRFLKDDVTMSPYLDGSKDTGVSTFGATNVIVEGYGV